MLSGEVAGGGPSGGLALMMSCDEAERLENLHGEVNDTLLTF